MKYRGIGGSKVPKTKMHKKIRNQTKRQHKKQMKQQEENNLMDVDEEEEEDPQLKKITKTLLNKARQEKTKPFPMPKYIKPNNLQKEFENVHEESEILDDIEKNLKGKSETQIKYYIHKLKKIKKYSQSEEEKYNIDYLIKQFEKRIQ
jgi:hypothetical protein